MKTMEGQMISMFNEACEQARKDARAEAFAAAIDAIRERKSLVAGEDVAAFVAYGNAIKAIEQLA